MLFSHTVRIVLPKKSVHYWLKNKNIQLLYLILFSNLKLFRKYAQMKNRQTLSFCYYRNLWKLSEKQKNVFNWIRSSCRFRDYTEILIYLRAEKI